MTGILQVFCCVFSGVLTSISIPNEIFPLGNPLPALFALTPFYIALFHAKTLRRKAILCFLQAVTVHLLSCYWLSNFHDFAILTLGASAAGTGGISALFSLMYHIPYMKRISLLQENSMEKPFYVSSNFRIFYFSSVYVLYEWFKSSGFLAFPWGTLSMATYQWKILAQTADITGTYGITFLFALVSAFTGEFFIAKRFGFFKFHSFKSSFLVIFSLFAISTVYGLFQYKKDLQPVKEINAALIQQNKDPWIRGSDTGSILTSMELTEKALESFKEQGKKADIVVWSEGILRNIFPLSYVYYTMEPEEEPLVQFMINHQVPFLIGGAYALDLPSKKFCNAALMFDANGNFSGWYGKRHLVPLAENIPFTEFKIVRFLLTKIIGFSYGWTPGMFTSVFKVPCSYAENGDFPRDLQFDIAKVHPPYSFILDNDRIFDDATLLMATPICFEDAFPYIFRDFKKNGAELFMNITDDSWSRTKSAEYQHFVIASFRAIEFRTTLVRSTNAGVSAVVDPKGNVKEEGPLFEKAFLSTTIPVYRNMETVYGTFLNWFNYLLLILVLLFALYMKSEGKGPEISLEEHIRSSILSIRFD